MNEMQINATKNNAKNKYKAVTVLIAGILFALFWLWGLPQILYPLWQNFVFLPENIYFSVEEFLALNTNHNSFFILIGGSFIIVCTLLRSLKRNRKLQKSYEYIFFAVIIFLTVLMLLPCLCAPREVGRRLQCISKFKETYIQLSLYADKSNGKLPDTFTIKESKHSVNYYGKGRSLKEKPFILLEDAERSHAGNLRHQLWSNGKITKYYFRKGKNL